MGSATQLVLFFVLLGAQVQRVVTSQEIPSEFGNGDTPFRSCCPPGGLLVIEDLFSTTMTPDGKWSLDKEKRKPWAADGWGNGTHHYEIDPVDAINNNKRTWYHQLASDMYGWFYDGENYVEEYHLFITKLSCQEDINHLRPLDKFSGSMLPDVPYDIILEPWRNVTVMSQPLKEDQTLRRSDIGLPTCKGGLSSMSTMVLGDGLSNGYGVSETGSMTALGEALDLDFCLTWDSDPRVKRQTPLLSGGKLKPEDNLKLKAVYCDDCKEKVLCSWIKSFIYQYFVMALGHNPDAREITFGQEPPPRKTLLRGLEVENLWEELIMSHQPWLKKGKTLNRDLFAHKIAIPLIKNLFNAMDFDGNEKISLKEANPEQMFTLKFLHAILGELFFAVDITNDGTLSIDDIKAIAVDWKPEMDKTYQPDYLVQSQLAPAFAIIISDTLEMESLNNLTFNVTYAMDGLFRFLVTRDDGMPGKHFLSPEAFLNKLVEFGEPKEMVQPILMQLRKFNQAVRFILYSVIKSADTDGDGQVSWEEFLDNSDFKVGYWGVQGVLGAVLGDVWDGDVNVEFSVFKRYFGNWQEILTNIIYKYNLSKI